LGFTASQRDFTSSSVPLSSAPSFGTPARVGRTTVFYRATFITLVGVVVDVGCVAVRMIRGNPHTTPSFSFLLPLSFVVSEYHSLGLKRRQGGAMIQEAPPFRAG